MARVTVCDFCDTPIRGSLLTTEELDGSKYEFHPACLAPWLREQREGQNDGNTETEG